MTSTTGGGCRSFGAVAVDSVLDLGDQPVADDLWHDAASAVRAPRYRLSLGSCRRCGLLQLDQATPLLANASHGHGSAFSGTVLEHENEWAQELLALPILTNHARVLDIGSGSGGLLRPFLNAGHLVRGWERDEALAAQANAAGVPTAHLDGNRDSEPGQHDLVLVNHTLSHADDLDVAMRSLSEALALGGILAAEFHSALGILTGGQFDVICHAHRSYLSLTALLSALNRHGLVVMRATTLPLHGGVIRLQAAHAGSDQHPDGSVAALLDAERMAGLRSAEAWTPVAEQAARVRERLTAVLAGHRRAGRRIAGYGAPSRGTTLINYCGLGAAELPRTADRSPAKQGRYLPGAATRVCTPEELAADPPDVLVVLVWPLRNEVLAQLADLRTAGTRFLFPLPAPEEVR
jgi:SAM-dependent methyltransferase